MREPLQYTTQGSEGPNYFRLYECEHLTDGTYGKDKNHALADRVIHLGEHASIVVCKHCWQHVKGMVTEELVRNAVRQLNMDDIREMLARPLEKA